MKDPLTVSSTSNESRGRGELPSRQMYRPEAIVSITDSEVSVSVRGSMTACVVRIDVPRKIKSLPSRSE